MSSDRDDVPWLLRACNRQNDATLTAKWLRDQVIALRLFLIEQYLLKQNSFWWPYIRTLPQPGDKHGLNAPLWEDAEDLKWLEGTNLGKAIPARKAIWKQEFDAFTERIDPQDREPYTWFVWHPLRSKRCAEDIGTSIFGLPQY